MKQLTSFAGISFRRSRTALVGVRSLTSVLWWLILNACLAQSLSAQTVEFEVLFDRSAPLGAAQEWSAALGQAGITSVRVRQQDGGRPSVQRAGQGKSASIHVVGIIDRSNALLLPNAKFSRSQTAQIVDWLKKQSAEPDEESSDPESVKPAMFGLSPADVAAIRTMLSTEVREATKGQSLTAFLKSASQQLDIDFRLDPALNDQLRAADAIADELQGTSCGTAIAVALHSAELGFVPVKKSSGRYELTIRAATDGEHWPIGWRILEKSVAEVAPKLFAYVKIEVFDQSAEEVLQALTPRLELPLFFDRPAMVRHDVDLQNAKVNYSRTKVYYTRVLKHILFTAKLKYDVRIDEAGHAFLWITTLKP